MNTKISCLIIEDEPPAMQLLEDYIRKLPMLELKGKFYDAIEALEYLKKQPADIIFLDINLPGLSGLELAELIPKDQKIIFTTAYAEHALDSFSFHVIDYLLKPVSFKRFLQAIQKLQLHVSPSPVKEIQSAKQDELLFIKTGRTVIRIQFSDIIYIEAHKEYLCIHTGRQKHLVYKRMKEMAASLPDSFVRIHNSYIINLRHVQKLGQQLVEVGGRELPVSAGYKEAFQQHIQQHMM
ncbi:LytTR family DNA-binding domain-containing protein [Sediminibacterium sp.]|uniref:LytR/AlgR family response regulator transcription factor n=1 Tax=Sediminibacterium sp. TaxID=1917865 RepID=UPI0025EE32FC|nr:LytTR family DNA-binding domain-containing protein [Sediminibacterium sp.]MBW0177957.1 LytTR family DNA-binding domain-containing protein [Sediminibacterium sp.]